MAIDPALMDAFGTSALRGFIRQTDWADQTGRDMHDFLTFDHRSLSAAIAREVAMAPNSQEVANLNTAIRTPSTVDHFALGAGPAAPGAPGGAGGASAGAPAK